MSKSALKILTTAEQLFNQQSFAAVGVDLIRDASGCSKTTLYTYYQNKQQLIYAVLEARDENFQENLKHYLAEKAGLEAIFAIIDWHVLWFQQDDFKGCLFIRAVAEANDPQTVSMAQQHKQQIYSLVMQYCEQMNQTQWVELIYTLIEGLISRCFIEGVDMLMIEKLKRQIQQLWIE